MPRSVSRRSLVSGLLLGAIATALIAGTLPLAAQDEKPAKKSARGRLPAYYGKVVDEEQRESIYKIQGEYSPRINKILADLEALMAERDKEIDAVLTPEQRQEVATMEAAARAKRTTEPESANEPAKTPAAEPAELPKTPAPKPAKPKATP